MLNFMKRSLVSSTLQIPVHIYIQGIRRGPCVCLGQDALYLQLLSRFKLTDGHRN